MQIRVITLRYAEGQQGFPKEALRKATFGREVLSVSEHFFEHGNVPHLTLVLSLGDVVQYDNNPDNRNNNGFRLSSTLAPGTCQSPARDASAALSAQTNMQITGRTVAQATATSGLYREVGE